MQKWLYKIIFLTEKNIIMTQNAKFITAGMLLVISASCAPKLAGTWNIEKYEVNEPGKSGVSVSNIGTISFDRNNTGSKHIVYSIFQNSYSDTTAFSWHKDNKTSIRIEAGDSSVFKKTWLIIEDDRKEQTWKSTDGFNKVQILKLRKL